MNRVLPTLVLAVVTATAGAQNVDPYYECAYRITDLGTPEAVPTNLGGIVFKYDDPNTIIIGGSANNSDGALYTVPVLRDAENHIIGFTGPGEYYADSPDIDGGLAYGPDNVLFYSRYPINHIGEIKPGSTTADKDIDLSALGFSSSVGAFMFVPQGFQGEGTFKIFPYNSDIWYSTTVTSDGNGTFDIGTPTTDIASDGGPEGIVYIEAGETLFPVESVLVSEYRDNQVVSFEIDSNGDIILATKRIFIDGLSGALGGTRDPLTGDFLFSTYGSGNRVLIVTGFDPNCDANYNADCAVNTQDVLDFLNDWVNGDPKADFNNDGSVNTIDFLAFLNAWTAGC